MSDRIQGLTVALDRDYKDDDVVAIVNAIMMIKGVHSVQTSVVEVGDFTARARLLSELKAKIAEISP